MCDHPCSAWRISLRAHTGCLRHGSYGPDNEMEWEQGRQSVWQAFGWGWRSTRVVAASGSMPGGNCTASPESAFRPMETANEVDAPAHALWWSPCWNVGACWRASLGIEYDRCLAVNAKVNPVSAPGLQRLPLCKPSTQKSSSVRNLQQTAQPCEPGWVVWQRLFAVR